MKLREVRVKRAKERGLKKYYSSRSQKISLAALYSKQLVAYNRGNLIFKSYFHL